MFDPTKELRVRAKLLQRELPSHHQATLKCLRRLPGFRRASDEALIAAAASIRRKHCLAIVAREAGFASWEHASRVIEGGETEIDHGDLLYRHACSVFLNHWFATYAEAEVFHRANGGFLLAYRRHYLVVKREYIATLGLDPDHDDWRAIGWNWPRPTDASARQRLYAAYCGALATDGPTIATVHMMGPDGRGQDESSRPIVIAIASQLHYHRPCRTGK